MPQFESAMTKVTNLESRLAVAGIATFAVSLLLGGAPTPASDSRGTTDRRGSTTAVQRRLEAGSPGTPGTSPPSAEPAGRGSESVPLDQIGAQATAQYKGEGLAVTVTPRGARLRCAFQKMDGEATADGLWLVSTAPGAQDDRFRVVASAVGDSTLSPTGKVEVVGALVRLVRPLLTEEYSVSVDGVRQDFIVERRSAATGMPATAGFGSLSAPGLRVELALSGARAEAADYGARLTLEGSGRALAYSRLRAVDARGRELPATLQVVGDHRLLVLVEDADATYPVRIDPTFSDANWVYELGQGIPGANNTVYALAVDGSGNLYAGGSFTFAGVVTANRIAKWDGSTWSALGLGMNDVVRALAVSGTELYAGGNFSTAGGVAASCIAKWDGSTWSPLGSGLSGGPVYALALSGADLYVGGGFTTAGGSAASRVAKWNGSSWSALGSGVNAVVHALAVMGGELYAGGGFTTAGGAAANYIAKWNGTSWSALGSGVAYGGSSPSVEALAVTGTNIYVGGYFTSAGGASANFVAKWNATTGWSSLGTGSTNGVGKAVEALAVVGTNVYVAGYLTTAGGLPANYIARWDGSAWSAMDSGLNGTGNALAVSGTDLYVGGSFLVSGGVGANRVAKWSSGSWSALGSGSMGMSASVSALALSGAELFVGGAFPSAGGVLVNCVARWDGSAWSALGSGMNNSVYALAVSGTDLYAGGVFTSAGGVTANRIAKWSPATGWSALGDGLNGGVFALAASGADIYAGGNFTTAGGATATNIARWNPATGWSALGTGLNSYVSALAVWDGNLYAGGNFTTAGDVLVNCIAQYNPATGWSALGSGMGSYVYALAASSTDLYVGGYFTTAGGLSANRIAKWNSTAGWSALGAGMNGEVRAIALVGGDLYAAGGFTTAGASAARCIAKWDGGAWSALGSGMNSTVYALAVSGMTLYAGGSFNVAGANFAAYIVQAELPSPQATTTTLGSSVNPTIEGDPVSFTATVAGTGGTPTGTVTFNDGATVMGTAALSDGMGTFTTSSLTAAGSPHLITAEYGGDAEFLTSTSSVLSQVVYEGMGGVGYADSSDFTLDTTGLGVVGGVGYADSPDFTLDTTGSGGVGGVAWADSGDFVLDTTDPTGGSYVWNGGTGDWFDPTQWTPQGVPGVTSEATIGAGTVTLNTPRGIGTLHLGGGTLRGAGLLTVSSLMDWLGGAMRDGGVTRVGTNATLDISEAADKNLLDGRTLENFGLVTWSGGTIFADAGCTISNRPGGVFQIAADAALTGSGTPQPAFCNEGLLVNTNATGTTTFNVPLSNLGTISLGKGLLACTGGLVAAHTSTLEIALSGPATGTDFGQLQVTGPLALAGTLAIFLQNNYLPANSNTFPVLTYSSKSGSFSSILLPPPTCFLYLSAEEGATATTVTALAPGPCITISFGSSPGTLQLDWSEAFADLKLQTSGDLVNGPWVDVSLPPGTHSLTITSGDQQGFYRLVPP